LLVHWAMFRRLFVGFIFFETDLWLFVCLRFNTAFAGPKPG